MNERRPVTSYFKLQAFWALFVAFSVIALRAQTQGPGVPAGSGGGMESGPNFVVTMDHEPHHHLALQNQYVRAFKVEVPPHAGTLLHLHPRDYIFVTIGDSSVESDVEGKPPAKLDLKDGEVRFTKGGFAHVAKNLSAKPFRNVTVELLQPVGDLKPPQAAEQSGRGTGCQFAGVMFPATEKILLSSDLVTVRDYELPRKCGISSEGKGTLVVALSSLVVTHSKKPANLTRGDLSWLAPGDAVVNRHRATARFVTVEFAK